MARILIVDDQAANRQFLSKLLGYVQHTVYEAIDGVEALETMRKARPDLIITDIVMPGMDGVTFTKGVRANPAFATIPIIFYTASHRVPQAEALAQQCGVMHVLHKPVRPADILKTVSNLLGNVGPEPRRHALGADIEALRLAALTELGLDLTKEINPAQVLHKVCQALRYITDAGFAGIVVLNSDGRAASHFARSSPDEDLPAADAEVTADALTRLLGNRSSIRLANPDVQPEHLGAWPGQPIESLVAAFIPLPAPRSTAALYAVSKTRATEFKTSATEFTADDEKLALTLATQAAVAYENARLHSVLNERARELEREVREREKFEEQYRQAERRLQHVVASSPVILFTLTSEGEDLRPTWVSENMGQMLGYVLEEVLQPRWWHEHVHPDDLDRARTPIQKKLFADGHVTSEYRFRNRGGEYRWIRSEMRLIRHAAAEPVEVIDSWFDITEQKTLEEHLHQSQKLEAIGSLAAGVAHDFNNLLTIINGYSDVIQEELPADSPVAGFVRAIGEAGLRAAWLTRQLLAFSRKQVLEPRALNLNAIVTDIAKMLKRLIGEDIDLITVLKPGLHQVKADQNQIEQALINLAMNARDAMPEGGKLTIETAHSDLEAAHAPEHTDDGARPFVRLAVTDTGCGMDDATKARIFDPFFTTKAPGQGTGLGLATVFGSVKQSGGHIAVESEVGHGTTFKIYLPVLEAKATAPSVLSQPGPQRSLDGEETILLAEDESAVRALACHVLQMHGYTVLDAGQADQALRTATEYSGKIHLLATDVVMPGINGRQLAERITALRPDIKVLYLSGYADDAIARRGIMQGTSAFLQKPFQPRVLAHKVREVLDR